MIRSSILAARLPQCQGAFLLFFPELPHTPSWPSSRTLLLEQESEMLVTNPSWMLQGHQMNPPNTTEYTAQVCLRFPRRAWEEASRGCLFHKEFRCDVHLMSLGLLLFTSEPSLHPPSLALLRDRRWLGEAPSQWSLPSTGGNGYLSRKLTQDSMTSWWTSTMRTRILKKLGWVPTEKPSGFLINEEPLSKGRARPSLFSPNLLFHPKDSFRGLALEIHRMLQQMDGPVFPLCTLSTHCTPVISQLPLESSQLGRSLCPAQL